MSACLVNSRLSRTILILFAVTVFLAVSSLAQTFPGTGTGAIPDGSSPNPTCGAPRNITFNVSGLVGPVISTTVSFTMTHTFIGDLQVLLIAPDNTTHVIFAYVGRTSLTGFGDSSDLNGTYVFADAHTGNIWFAAASGGNTFIIPGGNYRTQQSGPFSPVDPGPPFTSMFPVFLPVANPNGTWTLRFFDCAAADTGTVSAASLTLTSLGPTSAPATISGRAITPDGRGIPNVRIMAQGGELEEPVFAVSNHFGHYTIEGLPSGQTYIVSVASGRTVFLDPVRVVNLDTDLSDLNFVSEADHR